METVQGETIRPVADAPKAEDDVVKGQTIREAEIESLKAHVDQLQNNVVQGGSIDIGLVNKGTDYVEPKKDDEAPKLKLYSIYCEPCGFKKLTDGSDVAGLIPYKQSSIPGGSPFRDPLTGQIKTPPAKQNSKKFKCPKCGRVVTVRKVADPNTQTGRSFDE